jgi:hypothetical protein
LETFTEPKELMENPHFREQRQKSLSGLTDVLIDAPIIKIIKDFYKLPYCFTMQSCYGHFLYNGQRDPHNLDPLLVTRTTTEVEYRIAYIAFCVENSDSGRRLIEALRGITVIDPKNIQFCCAEWFWKKQVNSYALQVEPERFKHEDKAVLDCEEALKIEKARNKFFIELKDLLKKQQDLNRTG